MINSWLIFIPFLVQAVAIAWDEGHFHIKRGLPRWERIGHPIDTFSVLVCFAYVLMIPFSMAALKGYLVIAAISCILVTKDEFVHKHHCPAAEHWVHALLFINHPILLSAVGMMWGAWSAAPEMNWLLIWLKEATMLKTFVWGQLGAVFMFFIYQIVYWNIIYAKKDRAHQ